MIPTTQSDKLSSGQPFYTKWWFWAIVIAIGVVIAGFVIALTDGTVAASEQRGYAILCS